MTHQNQLLDKFKTSRKLLTNAESLSFILGTGTDKDLQIAKNLLQIVSYDLNLLGRLTMTELTSIKGITAKKAAAVLAAMELGIRRQATPINTKVQINCSQDIYNVVVADLKDLNHEEFLIVLLNQSNKVIEKSVISVGGLAGTVVDVKKIFKPALANSLCAAIILAHNHPSDNLNPSKADIDITRKIKEGGKFLDITVLDHIIVAGNSYTSLADEGLM